MPCFARLRLLASMMLLSNTANNTQFNAYREIRLSIGIFFAVFSFKRLISVLGLLEGDLDMFPRKEVKNMKVTKLEDAHSIQYRSEKLTEAALQNEHDYLVAEKLTKRLLEKGFITQTEFGKIMVKNRQTFLPLLAKIMA